MMISPETFRDINCGKSLDQLYQIRRELMEDLIDFEDNYTGESHMLPVPETRYVINNLYLMEICKLIQDKLDSMEEDF